MFCQKVECLHCKLCVLGTATIVGGVIGGPFLGCLVTDSMSGCGSNWAFTCPLLQLEQMQGYKE